MRTAEEKIKAAILHPEEEIRCVAARYFSYAHSDDPAVMPLVIEAVERYGRARSFPILWDAAKLVQTPATVQWPMAELGRGYDLKDEQQDNYRCAAALVLCNADPQLLVPAQQQALDLPALPQQLRGDLARQVERAGWDWAAGWQALLEWGARTRGAGGLSGEDDREGCAIVQALGRLRTQGQDAVMKLLNRRRGFNQRIVTSLEPQLVQLAGAMRLEPAIPLLIQRLHEDDRAVRDEVSDALVQIGTGEVVRALARGWPEGGAEYHYAATMALENIHCDLSVQVALGLLADEEDLVEACALGSVLMRNFAEEGIEPVREVVLREGGSELAVVDQRELRWQLMAAATIMGKPFAEYPAWYRESVEEKWGQANLEPFRLTEHLARKGTLEGRGEEWGKLPGGFVDATPLMQAVSRATIGRDDPCPCGSRKEYRNCCLHRTPPDPASN